MSINTGRVREYVETIAIPLIVEGVVMLAVFAAAFLWCGIGSGRI